MSSEKEALSPIPQSPAPDLPPAYDTLAATATLLQSLNDPQNDGAQAIKLTDSTPTTHTSPLSFRSSAAPPPKTHKRSPSASSTTSLKSKKSWFQFSSPSSSAPAAAPAAASARTVSEVRTTVVGLVHDLVRAPAGPGAPAAAARGILASCADVCAAHAVSLPAILQARAIEGHSALYWAAVQRLAGAGAAAAGADADGGGGEEDLVGAMLARCSALSPETVHELRLACLATSDQALFQRLRPRFHTASGADAVLLGAALRADVVAVELGAGTEGAFAATFAVAQYHTRMMIARELALEFVARNRIWRFALLITPDETWHGPAPGTWCISLTLQEPSPPTWLDAQLSLLDGGGDVVLIDGAPASLPVTSKQMLEGPRNNTPATPLVVALDNSPLAGLQYSGDSFTSPDGTLHLRLDAKLRKPDMLGLTR